MKIKNIAITTSLLLGTVSFSFANTTSLKSLSDNVNSFVSNTYNNLTNKNNTWGSQDRTHQWYVGLGVNSFIASKNSKSSEFGFNGVLGYNLDRNIALQYNQFITLNDMYGGLAEVVMNFSNDTMITPYATAGLGYASLSNEIKGTYDFGAGIKFQTSKDISLFVGYKQIRTMGSSKSQASVNVISTGINFYFGGNSSQNMNTKIKSDIPTNYLASEPKLPKNIELCKQNYNLSKNGKICYTIENNQVAVHLDTKFGYNSYLLETDEKAPIIKFVKFIKNNNITKITLKGYSSKGKTGSNYAKYNKKLSQMRAIAVKDFMVSLGIKQSSINIESFGYTNPLLTNNSKTNKSYNRRVQSTVIFK